MNRELMKKEIKDIIDKVFDRNKKSIANLKDPQRPGYNKYPKYPVWNGKDEYKITEEIIKDVIEKFPQFKGKENNLHASLRARFWHTKPQYPADEYFTLDGAFDKTPERFLEILGESFTTYERYLNIINEAKDWKSQITNILNPILEKSSNNYEEQIKEITNTRIIVECVNDDESFNAEIVFHDLEIKLRRPNSNYIELESGKWEKKIPLSKAKEIIKIWKERK